MEKELSFKEVTDKFIRFDDPSKEIVMEVLLGKSIVKVAKEYQLGYNDVVDMFIEKVRAAFVGLADGPSADGKLTLAQIKKFIRDN
jgi:hypothetical protein